MWASKNCCCLAANARTVPCIDTLHGFAENVFLVIPMPYVTSGGVNLDEFFF
jgi:hypothetical protein